MLACIGVGVMWYLTGFSISLPGQQHIRLALVWILLIIFVIFMYACVTHCIWGADKFWTHFVVTQWKTAWLLGCTRFINKDQLFERQSYNKIFTVTICTGYSVLNTINPSNPLKSLP